MALPAGAFVSLADATRSYFTEQNASHTSVNNTYHSFRATLLLFDTTEQERRGLAFKRLTKLTQPWVTVNTAPLAKPALLAGCSQNGAVFQENPLFFHLSNTTPAGVRQAVDDAVEVGIEMIVQSFGTSWKMEDDGALCKRSSSRRLRVSLTG